MMRLKPFRKRAPAPEAPTFTVYTRRDCCCCHKAIELLTSYQKHYRFGIKTVDVDGDVALAAQHGTSVPVAVFGGKVRFRGVVNPALLERLLKAEVG